MTRRYLKKDSRNKSDEGRNLTIAERSTRIVLILTLFGTFGFVVLQILRIFIEIFSNKIYLHFPYREEHIILILIVSSLLITFYKILKYVYFELYSFNNYFGINSNENYGINAAKKANLYYYEIFTSFKELVKGSIIIGYLAIGLLNVYLQNYIVIISVFIFIVAILIMIVIKKNKVIDAFKPKKEFKKSLRILLIVSIFVFFSGTQFYLQPIKIDVNFKKEGKKQNLTIKSDFYAPSNVNIAFYRENINGEYILTENIFLEKGDFLDTFIEAKESESSSSAIEVLNVIDNQVNKFNEAYVLNDSDVEFNYKLDYNKYIRRGNNIVIVDLKFKNGINNKSYRVKNHIRLRDGKYEVLKESFSVNE